MSKKYIWVVLILMLLTICFIQIDKLVNKNNHNSTPNNAVAIKEDTDKVITANFYDKTNNKIEASFSKNNVTFTLQSIGTITLSQIVSVPGRYINSDESIVFLKKGNGITIYQNGKIVFEGSTLQTASVPNLDNTVPKGKLPAGSAPSIDPKLIQGTTWLWQKNVMNNSTIITPKKDGQFTINFNTKGDVSGKTDCNGFSGTYLIGTDNVISFGPMISTMMFCEGSQEQVYTSAISASKSYMLDENGNLILLNDLGSIIFKKQQ
jgi:heat shock protein HslJ